MEGVTEPENNNRIVCGSCKKFSGYLDQDVRNMITLVTKSVCCMNCGHACIKLLGPNVLQERKIGLETLRKLDL